MAKKNSKEVQAKIDASNAIARQNIVDLDTELNKLNSIFDLRKRQVLQEQKINEQRQIQENTTNTILKLQTKGHTIHGNILNRIEKENISFRDKTVLFSGCGGFLGSWTCDVMVKQGAY